VAAKKAYPLRINPDVLKAMQNAQIEYVLRDALRKQGRLKETKSKAVKTRPQKED